MCYNFIFEIFFLLGAESPVSLELPNQWLWEIIDEFIYQFQSFSQFRSKLQKKTDTELETLRESPKIWNVHSVLNVLHCLVDKSNINRQLEVSFFFMKILFVVRLFEKYEYFISSII